MLPVAVAEKSDRRSMMLEAATWLLIFQLAGEIIARLAGLPLPGPVLGMAMLVVALFLRPALAEKLGALVDGLLANLGLLFIPAGVGVSLHLGLLREEWLPILVALVGSTIAGIVVTALVYDTLSPSEGADGEKQQ
jgi:holin-like protein